MDFELSQIYSPEIFRKQGHQLVDILADHLNNMLSPNDENKVINWTEPDEELEYWQHFKNHDVVGILKTILNRSINLHHPNFMGHQVSMPAPAAVLASFQGALLNNGMAVYEMGASASALEKLVIDALKPYFGLGAEADGILTSGGTIANLTALLCARSNKTNEDIWHDGTKKQYAFMVSDEAHYCIDRAVRIMGWGSAGIIKIPVDKHYRMRTELLDHYLQNAASKDVEVLGVIGSAPSTSTGIYDDLEAIGTFCKKHKLWFHIDGAHGGPAVFSEKFSYLMKGSNLADSITVDAHKMMMTPALTTMLFFKKSSDSYRTFAQKADYLWNANDEEWFNYGKRTMECTKLMMSTRIFTLLQAYGVQAFSQHVEKCYDLAKIFAKMIHSDDRFEMAVEPDSNIVCFRVISDNDKDSNELNDFIRKSVLKEGKFYIVKTSLKGQTFLRTSLMNPFTTDQNLKSLLDEIIEYSKKIKIVKK